MKRRGFACRGMAVVLCVYLVMATVLFAERAGVRYEVFGGSISLLSADQAVRSQDAYAAQAAECLVLLDSRSASSMAAEKQFRQMFLDMKVGCQWVDISRQAVPPLAPFRTVLVLLSELEPLGEWVVSFADWVYAGGRAMLALPVVREPVFSLLEQKVGIAAATYDYEYVDSIRFADSFLLGGEGRWFIPNGYASALRVNLRPGAELIAWEDDAGHCPLIWRNAYGQGRFVVVNMGQLDKPTRGIYAACYSLLEDVFAYPVINASAFYLDDFPSPVPSGDSSNIRAEYNMTIEEFYTNIWMPDMLRLAEKYGVRYTAVVIESYDDQTDGSLVAGIQDGNHRYFGNLLLQRGGEIGLHGYNHQPLCLGNTDYEDILPYYTWENEEAMRTTVSELIRFVTELFPEVTEMVYVPPSNVLSAEGRAMLGACFPQIHTIASVYCEGDFAYTQEYGVAEDGVVEQPRVISGTLLPEDDLLTALSELNMHFVNSHFMHPDDLLDEERRGRYTWEELRQRLDDYMDWLFTAAPPLRSVTGTDFSGAVQRFSGLTVERNPLENGLELKLGNFVDEAYLLMRLEGKEEPKAQGGALTQMDDSLYLLRAEEETVIITWGR